MTTEDKRSEYAKAGVDYRKMTAWKEAMVETARRTIHFPNKRNVFIRENLLHAHGGVYEYRGNNQVLFCQTTEGLGNKNWIAQWMAENAGTGRTYYEGIPIDNALMAVNDNVAQGAMPVAYTDEVAAGKDDWFQNEQRAKDIGEGFYKVCEMTGMALVAGESPALKYLVNTLPPVKENVPSFSGCVVGIVDPASGLITGENVTDGDMIIGVTSSGLSANGISLVIKKGLELPDKFLTKLPDGKTLGDHALVPTRSYVDVVEAWLGARVPIHALVPVTGGGVSKLAFDERPFTYRITDWPAEIPLLFRFMKELGISTFDLLTTFNWGIGYFAIMPKSETSWAIQLAKRRGYEALVVGQVEEGKREVIFGPKGDLVLPPQGE